MECMCMHAERKGRGEKGKGGRKGGEVVLVSYQHGCSTRGSRPSLSASRIFWMPRLDAYPFQIHPKHGMGK